jgi:hypothetical protein
MAKLYPINPTRPPVEWPRTTSGARSDRPGTSRPRNRPAGIYDHPKAGWPTWASVVIVIAILVAVLTFIS